MKPFQFIIRSIIYYRRQHLGLFLGMAISAAVLTGALIIGDSIQYSLEKLVGDRLGKTNYAVIGGSRFMDTTLAPKLESISKVPVAQVLMLKGIAINPATDARLNETFILGIDKTFNRISGSPLPELNADDAIINLNLADRLNLKPGDDLVIRVQSASIIPVNAPFSREPSPTIAIRLKIKAIANEDQAGMFNLSNSQTAVYNIFVSLGFLGDKMDLAGLSNILLIPDIQESLEVSAIEDSVQQVWSLKDMGLAVRKMQGTDTYDLISHRIFIDTIVQQVTDRMDLRYEEIVTYLVNDIGKGDKHTPYSFASAVSPAISGNNLSENEVILNRWTADDLGAGAGDSVVLAYYEIGPLRKLYETSQKFLVKEIIGNTARVDSTLMPKFPGLSEAGNCSDWDAGVPIDLKKIRDKDEIYWDEYRGTPKVILSLEKGKRMWRNPFGIATTMRFKESIISKDTLASILLTNIKPSDIGFQVVDVRSAGMSAAGNAVNFTELFLGMSFFVIAAGLLLTVLLYSLHFSRRSPETALLSGLGLSFKKILMLRVSESLLVILAGSIAGALLGILYNNALISGINTIWKDMVRMDMLRVHVTWKALLTGAVISMIFALIPVYIFTFRKLRKPVSLVIKGQTYRQHSIGLKKTRGYLHALILLAVALSLVIVSLVTGSTDSPLLYLISGSLFLLGGLAFIRGITVGHTTYRDTVVPTILTLSISNLKRNPGRSLAVIALLAVGTFTVILTGAYRKTYHGTEQIRKSGTGGYLLWARTISPVLFDLNSSDGKERLIEDDSNNLQGVRFLQFEKIDGDDASCLNLNQAQQPEILAVNPSEFDSTGAFSFVKVPAGSEGHPWLDLDRYINDSIFPAFADQTVLTYSLKKKAGDTLFYINESGKKIGLLITGSINNSIFQGNILISEQVFRKQFPSAGGSRVIMADGPVNKLDDISVVLSRSLADYGIDVMPAGERLAMFSSVENTYLSVFMALSGLGFIIGTIGLGIVLLRNIYERRKELALLLAVGYSRKGVFRLVFIENLFLLFAGWGIGMIAAIVGILPSLLSPSFDLQGGFIILLITGILVSGMVWIYFPLRSALSKPLIPVLRNE